MPPAGADGVRALTVGDIVAWVATTADARVAREGRRAAAEAVRHDRVIAHALARNVTPVPATLADPYLDDAELCADVASRSLEIRDSLRRIGDAVEMAVILAPRDADPDPDAEVDPASGPGRRYLERLRDLPSRLSAAADDIDQRLLEVAVDTRRRTDKDRVGLSHLVRRPDVQLYRSIAMSCISDRYRFVVDGPRAPYSFAAFSPRHVHVE